MSDAEREHWDLRYATEGARSTDPAAFLVEVADQLPSASRILDVGGGSGRNSVWLAKRGHDVTIVDISEPGLAIAAEAAREAGVEVTLVQADLDTAPLPGGPWDVIVDFHFIKRHLFDAFLEALRPGGLLVFCRATVKNLERNERPPQPFLLERGEGWDLLSDFELLIAREGWSAEDRHEFEALARAPGADG
ncbi:MAG: class I SAM-dependent methyltransferase [Acidimicrobiia bacterium]|nr:class I SAM-dependent methyltransferase [Acidimicrobiia bacterium]